MSTTSESLPNEAPSEWLTRQIERRRMTVRHFADAMGVTSKTVYDWRDGRTAISEERVPRLAEILGISEIEARRGLGFWVPSDTTQEQPKADGLDAVEEMLEAALAELNRLKREARGKSA